MLRQNQQQIEACDLMLTGAKPVYSTDLGVAYQGDAGELLSKLPDESVNLVMTSPPFALQRQKEYGNQSQDDYVDWLMGFARLVHRKCAMMAAWCSIWEALTEKDCQFAASTIFGFYFASVMKSDSSWRKIFTGSIPPNFPARSNG